eukprot:m51a1_g2495 putative adenylate guanylate cyclase (942) ;mRNA; r:101603-108821
MLNGVFSQWDEQLDNFSVEKIKTIGDAYMVVSGVPIRCEDHGRRMMRFAIAMLGTLHEYNRSSKHTIRIRIGINAGPVIAGIIGTRKIAYDLWGDTVNIAARMEHTGVPGCVQVNEAMYHRWFENSSWKFECRGPMPTQQGKPDMAVKLVLSATRAFAWDTKPWVHAAFALALSALLVLAHWHVLPYWRKFDNCVVGGFCCAFAAGAVPQLVAAIVGDSVVPFAVCCSLLLPAGIGGFVGFLVYQRSWERWVSDGVPLDRLAFRRPEEVSFMVRKIYNVNPGKAAVMMPRALDIVVLGKEAFPKEPAVHMEHAMLLFEVGHDTLGAVAHLRAVKRLKAAPDTRFLVSSLLQAVQNANQEAEKKEEVQVRLSVAAKHHKLCRALNARFWQLLVRSHSDSIDVQQLLKLVRDAAHHQKKSADIIQDLLRENPHSVTVLRAWSKHLSELKNNKEGAEMVLVLADQCEEEQSKRHRRSSASAGQFSSEESSHARAVRRQIETAKSVVLGRLHMAVLGTLAALVIGSVVNFAVSVSTMDQYRGTLRDMAKTITTRGYSTVAVMKIREFEMAQIAGNLSDAERQWDAGYMFANTLRSVCNMSIAKLGVKNLRTTHEFRFVMENGPTVFVAQLRALGDLYARMSVRQAEKIQTYLYGFYPATIAEKLLLNIFPRQVADRLNTLSGNDVELDDTSVLMASQFEEATVLFADIVGFTTLSSKLDAESIVEMLNGVFSQWDEQLDNFSVEKIKTIGDAYMVVSGVPIRCEDHGRRMMRFAIAMLGTLHEYNRSSKHTIRIRIGINAGPVIAGIIGTRKIAYDLWGDTVNIAARMEHTGVPGCVQVNEAMYHRWFENSSWKFECRGPMPTQGKPDMEAPQREQMYPQKTSTIEGVANTTSASLKQQSSKVVSALLGKPPSPRQLQLARESAPSGANNVSWTSIQRNLDATSI